MKGSSFLSRKNCLLCGKEGNFGSRVSPGLSSGDNRVNQVLSDVTAGGVHGQRNKHFRQKEGERQNLRRWNPGRERLWEFALAALGSGAEAPPCGLRLWGKILPVPPLADGKALPVEKPWEVREALRIIAGSRRQPWGNVQIPVTVSCTCSCPKPPQRRTQTPLLRHSTGFVGLTAGKSVQVLPTVLSKLLGKWETLGAPGSSEITQRTELQAAPGAGKFPTIWKNPPVLAQPQRPKNVQNTGKAEHKRFKI